MTSFRDGITQLVAAAAVLGAASFGGYYLVVHKPTAPRASRDKQPVLVEVVEAMETTQPMVVVGSGTVVPSRVVDLQPEVPGRVVAIGDALRPGALLPKGALIAKLDGRDYGIALRRAHSDKARAEADLEIERGQQEIARREVEIFERDSRVIDDKKRALRQPQLAGAEAGIQGAKATLAKAQLDLSRTQLTAPFDAMVRDRMVSVGSRVTESTTLATVVGVDLWWIRAEIPKDQLRFIALPSEGKARVLVEDEAAWGAGVTREGVLLEVGSEVVAGGTLVQVLIGVDDPLARQAPGPRLLLGSWVRVALEGKDVTAVRLPRKLVHDGDLVWVMTSEGRLDIRHVTISGRTRDEVLVTAGVESGEQVVSSAIPWPVQDMDLAVVDGAKSAKSE
jgi:RND family efflux transporter MFP subunit